MNKIIKPIASIMIIILIIALIWIFLAYYKSNESINTVVYPSGNSVVSSLNIPNGDYANDEKTENNLVSGQSLIDSIIGNPSIKEGKKESGENIESGEKITNTEEPPEKVDIIITSDPQTSNSDKQEVLTEIDKALQGLLEAVSKVETVDETRLDASLNSEVDNQ